MIPVTAKDLWAHKRRLLGTVFAVFLGVAFLTGTLALSDTLRANFNSLFTNANAGTDAVVRSATTVASEGLNRRALIPASVLSSVRSAPGVADAQPVITGYGQLIGSDGKAVGGVGPPRQAGNWVTDPALNPYRLVEGRAPRADDEVVINRGAAKAGHLHVGDTTVVQIPDPIHVRIVGIATFGTADGFGQATFAAFTDQGATQHLLKGAPQLTTISVKAAPGVSQDQLVSQLRPVLPSGVEAISGAQLTADNISTIAGLFLNVLRDFLLVFAGIALLVATFSIYNTLSILVAQRTRESALLRALGATRGQTFGATLVESLGIGIVASALGLLGGIGIAGLLKATFDVFGFALPAGGLVFKGSTAVIGLVVGVGVTAIAGTMPAVAASRVSPLAALRDVAAPPARVSLRRILSGVVLAGTGMAVVLSAVTGHGSSVLGRAGLGALLMTVGVVVLGPVVAAPVTGILAWPLVRLRGVTGSLARQNAMRNPRRTSATAAALMVGVSVVTLFTVFAASLSRSVSSGVSGSVHADLVVASSGFGGGMSPQLARDVAALPAVSSAAGLGEGYLLVAGHREQISVLDTASSSGLLDLGVARGSVTGLGPDQLAVSEKTAASKGWRMGTVLPVTFSDGVSSDLTVGAIYRSRTVARDYVLPSTAWLPHAPQALDTAVFIGLRPGVPLAAAEAEAHEVAAAYGSPTVYTRSGYISAAGSRVNTLLGLIYVMLALAILIALLGIANTLSLSTHERTRELGLLRAVGQTRAQLRAMVRWESVTIAVFGTVGGLGLGAFLGWALVKAASTAQGIASFSAPPGQLVTVLVVGAVAGVLAGLRPARRAARLDVLAAIAQE